MPQNCQIIGVNSVTNIGLDKGVMPAPIIRNADWFEKIADPHCWPQSLARREWLCTSEGACAADGSGDPYLLKDSGKWPIF